MKQYIIFILLSIVNSPDVDDLDQVLAKELLKKIHLIANQSLENCALLINVSSSTLNRFCKRYGFNNYSTFRELLREDDEYPKESFNRDPVLDMDELLTLMRYVESIDLSDVLNLLHSAKNIYFIGLNFQFEALHFQQDMLMYNKYVNLVNPANRLSKVDENDLVIFLSMNGVYLKIGYKNFDKIKCKKILITQDESNDYDFFDEVIQLKHSDSLNNHKYELSHLFDLILYQYQKFM